MELFPYSIYKKLRELSAPIDEIVNLIPYSSSVLDVGCGRGVMAERILRERKPERYVGVDIDESRILKLKKRFADAEFVSMDAKEYVKLLKDKNETFSCILFSDILYLLSDEDAVSLIYGAYELLKIDGLMIVKEVDLNLPVWLQEFISVKLLRMTRGKNLYLRDVEFYERLLDNRGLNFAIIKYRRLWYPHIIITLRK
ncbi:MAG: class I SAM-dependent methyltransferase [Myxococcota bacterium]